MLAAPCPRPLGVAVRRPSPAALAQARRWRFRVYRHAVLTLRPPIDWLADPLHALRFRDTFPKLRFLDPLTWAYARRHDVGALREALSVLLDWARSNPLGGSRTAPAAWLDKVTGDRVPYISYLTRAAACEGLLGRGEARLLLRSIAWHERVLVRAARADRTNHGLFASLGLALLSRYFPFLGEARRWAAEARHQFLKTLRGRLGDGVWLEHSTAYQFLAIRAVERFVAYTGDPAAERLLRRMKRAAGWFVEPDGRPTQFGDSYLVPVPAWGKQIAARQRGLEALWHAGFAFVKAPGAGGYLAVASDFHNTTHKQADELSFALYDHGQRIVTDTGLYHKDPGAIRDFVLSARAHSVLTVDGRSFPISDPANAYGSGLVAVGEGDGWYAIEGRNPLLANQGVRHTRLFLYRPGVALVVVDRLRSAATHAYQRYFQLGPRIAVERAGAGRLRLSAPGFRGWLYDAPRPAPAAVSEVRGSRHPLAGLTSPRFRVFRPRWTVELESRGATSTRCATISLDRRFPRATAARAHGGGFTVILRERGAGATRLAVERSGRTLRVTAGGAR